MKKRLTILAICTAFVSAAIVGAKWLTLTRSSAPFSAPYEIRTNAAPDFDRRFVLGPDPIPDLTNTPSPPSYLVDESATEELIVRWNKQTEKQPLEFYGDQIHANPATQIIPLPNGQEIRLIGVAYFPKHPDLSEFEDRQRPRRKYPVIWRNPISMKPIPNPELIGLDPEIYLSIDQQLLFAFHCTDIETRPVRWHPLRVHDDRTKASVTIHNDSRFSVSNGITVCRTQLKIFHDTPLRVLLPISFGETEDQEIDLKTPNQTIRFGGDALDFTLIMAREGEKTSVENRIFSERIEARIFFQNSTPESGRDRSFTIFSIWPPTQAGSLQFFHESTYSWVDLNAAVGVKSQSHKVHRSDLVSQKWRRFPRYARAIFQLKGIPDLPKLNNLFAAEVGPLRFEDDGAFRSAISTPTLFEWERQKSIIPDDEFPIEFSNPGTTPAQLLSEYENYIGLTYKVDEVNHRFKAGEERWPGRMMQLWQKFAKWFSP